MADIDYEHIIANANKGPYSMTFNGTALDTYIPNLVIYAVEGRDNLSSDVYEYSYTRVDGARFQFRRHDTKDITVRYTVISNTNSGQRSTLNTLRGILQKEGTENAKIIFADEPDKYWVGTVSSITEDKITYNNTSNGEIIIHLSKPFKYAVNETTVASQTLNNKPCFVIDYDGTYKAFPVMTVTFPTENRTSSSSGSPKGDCGYVAFLNDDGEVLQFGDPDETNLDSKSSSTTMINQKFTSWDSSVSSVWSNNTATGLGDNYSLAGGVGKTTMFSTDLITPSGYGSGDKWHGPSITYQLTSTEITDFTLEFGAVFADGGNPSTAVNIAEEEGITRAIVHNDTGIIAEIRLVKNDKSSNNGKLYFYTCGAKEQYSAAANYETFNTNFGWKKEGGSDPKRTCIIQRKGNTFDFTAGATKKSFTSNAGPSYANPKYVTFFFGKWGTNYPISSIGLTSVKFTDDHWATGQDKKNNFTSNDVCVVNCEEARVYLNGIDTPSLGAVGNQWEQFYLKPGQSNVIGVNWSSWVTDANKPTFSLKYRKVYL